MDSVKDLILMSICLYPLRLILIYLSGKFNGYMDLSSEGVKNETGFFWEKIESKSSTWKNKYKTTGNDRTTKLTTKHSKSYHWWYLWLYAPKYKEKYPFSSTLLVGFTDTWHKYKMLHNKARDIAGLLLVTPMLVLFPYTGLTIAVTLIVPPIMRGIGFHSSYKKYD